MLACNIPRYLLS